MDAAVFRSGVDSLAQLPGSRAVRKIPQDFAVRFALAPAIIATREGPVPVAPGDAVVTGTAGEQWPVARTRFAAKYAPVPPTRWYEDGVYRSLDQPALACQCAAPFSVLLADGVASLQGQAGDWLLDYSDGSLGIVAQSLFHSLYQIQES